MIQHLVLESKLKLESNKCYVMERYKIKAGQKYPTEMNQTELNRLVLFGSELVD